MSNARGLVGNARVPALDGVRGIAILTVLLGHLTDYGGMQAAVPIDRLYHRVAMLGGLGVDLFFVLSGFLITGILLDAKDAPHYYRNFYARRVLRIFPLYYAFLLVVFVLGPAIGFTSSLLNATLPDQGWYWAYLANYRIAGHGWPPFGGIGHFWSLAVEEQFYVLWPLIVAVSSRRTFTWLCGALVVAGPLVRLGLWSAGLPPITNVITPARADALALGALLAVLARGPEALPRMRRWVGPIAAASTLALAAMLVWAGGWNTSQPVIPIGGRSLTIFASAGLIVLAIASRPGGLAQRILSNPVLTFYGVISYGLYVFHPPLLILFSRLGLSVRSLPTIGGSQLPGQLLVIVVGTIAATTISYLSFRFFESPILSLKSRFGSPATIVPAKLHGNVVAMGHPRNPLTTKRWKPGDDDRRRAPRGAA